MDLVRSFFLTDWPLQSPMTIIYTLIMISNIWHWLCPDLRGRTSYWILLAEQMRFEFQSQPSVCWGNVHWKWRLHVNNKERVLSSPLLQLYPVTGFPRVHSLPPSSAAVQVGAVGSPEMNLSQASTFLLQIQCNNILSLQIHKWTSPPVGT